MFNFIYDAIKFLPIKRTSDKAREMLENIGNSNKIKLILWELKLRKKFDAWKCIQISNT